ncbi:hypothetical protein ACFZAM_33470 [Streptomyces sp. NPDC008079]|uniref:hypothetical protein n=1 Tax=Streptomyces sp. NPDC008079 TaxID=3364806 RepID=UPI0036EBE8FE
MSEDSGDDRTPVDLFGSTSRVGIAGELVVGAQRLALRALKAYAQDDHEVSALLAGVSVERLTKWALASRNPVLIVDTQQKDTTFKHLLHLSGIREQPTKDLRTVGLGGALDRLRDLGVFTPKERTELKGLVDRRNGVVHTAALDEGVELVMAEFIETAERLLTDRGESRTWFWGDQLALVDEVRAQADRAIERAVHLRIQRAKSRYSDRVRGMDQLVVASLASSAMARIDRLVFAGKKLGVVVAACECPACNCPATIILDRAFPVTLENLRPVETFRQLTCPTCGLEITGKAELSSAGVDLEKLDVPGISRPARGTRMLPDDLAKAEVDLFMMLVPDRDEEMFPDWEPDFDAAEGPNDDEAESEGESYEP